MHQFLQDRRGAVAPFLGITIFLLVGIGALAIELPRMASFTTDLQNAADAAALAGAAELTGESGAISRATSAAINTFSNVQHFGSGSSTLTLTSANIDFLSAIPSHDSDPIPSSDVTTKDSAAEFIRVTIPNQGINFIFSVIYGLTSTTASVTAVAGNNAEICQTPPIFLCNPSEPSTNTDTSLNVDFSDPTTDSNSVAGKSIRAVLPGTNGSFSPGNFGLLCPAGTTSSNCNPSNAQITQMFAAPEGTCIRTQNTTTQSSTGLHQGPVTSGLNVRFDDWDSNTIGFIGNSDWKPAYDVTQGRYVAATYSSGNFCPKGSGSGGIQGLTSTPPSGTTTEPLMPDTCLLTNTCTGVNGDTNVGDGTWDRATYFAVNHNSSVPTDQTSGSPYDVYRWEVENPDSVTNSVVVPKQPISNSTNITAENGQANNITSPTTGAACYSGGTTPDTFTYYPNKTMAFQALADRRVMPVAIVDCVATSLGGGGQAINPVEWDYAFLLGPIGDPFYYQSYTGNQNAIFLQLLGKMDQTALNQMTHNVVRLYRR